MNVSEYSKYDSSNCSTIVVGKNASVTGKVLLGHNEDDGKCILEQHLVPRIKHADGETISFKDGKAVIPQVRETYSYLWTEVRVKGGISFADGFINEWGLAVVSNACRPSKLPEGDLDVGIGYGIRRLVAERAKTAREAVAVAAELVEKYGYFSSRTYTFADKDEAWSFQIPTGHNYAARRVGDDEILYIPNWFTIHNVDMNDKENFACSETLITNAIQNGWYTPKTENDYSDFDYAAAYQDGDMAQYNIYRARNAWRMLTGKKLSIDEIKPFSMKAEKKYSARDLKEVLQSHYEGTEDDRSNGYEINPHQGGHLCRAYTTICNGTTVESMVVEFNENPYLTRALKTTGKPCISPYTPWYPVALTRIPDGYNYQGPEAAQISHFVVDDEELKLDRNKAWWSFKVLRYMTEFDYKNTHDFIHSSREKLEAKFESEKVGIERAFNALKDVDIDAAKEILTSYTCECAKRAWDWADNMIFEVGEARLEKNYIDQGIE